MKKEFELVCGMTFEKANPNEQYGLFYTTLLQAVENNISGLGEGIGHLP